MDSVQKFNIFELTWNIPENYGGMTSAMLYRTEQFERFGLGKDITILTLAAGLDVDKTGKTLRARWGISDNVNVRNIWHDLRTLESNVLVNLVGESPDSSTTAAIDVEGVEERPYMRVSKDASDAVVRRQHLRADGSLLLTDELSLPEGRRMTLFSNDGIPLKTWRAGSDLYLSWLQFVMGKDLGVLINEDKRIGEFLHRYSCPNTKIIQVIHGTHLANRNLAPYGPLLKLRTNTVKNLTKFDRVTVLTRRQYDDISNLGVDMQNVSVLPNATAPRDLSKGERVKRPDGKGAIVGKLTPLKRVDHAVKAVTASAEYANVLDISLDVFGDGPTKGDIEQLRMTLGDKSVESVSLKGHVKDAASLLSDYSFLLMTSTSEGQSLVLLEAMSQGCIPIAYDIRYGPSDLIVDGVNGFLVPSGDIDALGRTIRHFVSLPEATKVSMRQAATESVRKFYPAENMRRWADMFETLWEEEESSEISSSFDGVAFANATKLEGSLVHISGVIRVDNDEYLPELCLITATRDGSSFVKSSIDLVDKSSSELTFSTSVDLNKLPTADKSILDFYVSPSLAGWSEKIRLKMNIDTRSKKSFVTKVYETKHNGFSIDLK
ncbi:glycosyltransferase [Arthrobacter sp. S41]|uniref:glycosyltransferase n=1 Tax=Arthrobacter sp. S41 TaxID=2509721 RepID=UPI0013EF936D|nr:glycosyltransferase [Arthrobacter sp. S41]